MSFFDDEVKAIIDHEDCWAEITLKRVLLIGVVVGLDVSQRAIIGQELCASANPRKTSIIYGGTNTSALRLSSHRLYRRRKLNYTLL